MRISVKGPEPGATTTPPRRRSLALYYYTYERLPHDTHSTLWRDRPADAGKVSAAMSAFQKNG